MKIDKINQNNQSFGMAVKLHPTDKKINKYLYSLPYDEYMNIEVVKMDSKKNPIDVFLSVINKRGKDRLQAEVGYKTFVEGRFQSAYKTVRKAAKFANKLHEEQKAQNSLWNQVSK